MCPSSWKLYLDDFPFFGSSLAHLEPELELFEVDDIGHDGDDDLSFHYLPNLAVLGQKSTFFRREQKFLYSHNRKPPRYHDIKWPKKANIWPKMTKNFNFGPNLTDFL